MCWKSYNGLPQRRVAEKDIPVFKICFKARGYEKAALPYYQMNKLVYMENETYRLGKELYLYKEKIGHYYTEYCIDAGLHSYSAKHIIQDTRDCCIEIITESGGNLGIYGRHACLVLCIIPKGAEYYVNTCGEYVSNKLTVKHICDTSTTTGDKNRLINRWRNLKFD